MGGRLYKQVDIWKRSADGNVHCYRCFETIPAGEYCVQSRDTRYNNTLKRQLPQLDLQHVELLLEDSPDVRSELHKSLEEAIAAFDKDFGNDS